MREVFRGAGLLKGGRGRRIWSIGAAAVLVLGVQLVGMGMAGATTSYTWSGTGSTST